LGKSIAAPRVVGFVLLGLVVGALEEAGLRVDGDLARLVAEEA
jgi:hypothetical protein